MYRNCLEFNWVHTNEVYSRKSKVKKKSRNFERIKKMATQTIHQHLGVNAAAANNEHQKRQLVYAKYRELLSSYNGQTKSLLEANGPRVNGAYPRIQQRSHGM